MSVLWHNDDREQCSYSFVACGMKADDMACAESSTNEGSVFDVFEVA